VTQPPMTKPTRKMPKSRADQLRDTLEEVRSQPGASALIKAYDNLRAMNSLQEIQRQIASMPPVVVSSHSTVN
jgi:hypothetical protein